MVGLFFESLQQNLQWDGQESWHCQLMLVGCYFNKKGPLNKGNNGLKLHIQMRHHFVTFITFPNVQSSKVADP